ncbi:hypothetical protein AB0H71_33600 [Nocardia sp. NPDC050697]|uniref:hypothetical protein n=1 Tax=Nocardia sp. NPDC050697 TaxID=3155158 RepID=UPI0033E104DB
MSTNDDHLIGAMEAERENDPAATGTVVDRELARAYDSLRAAADLAVTANGERAARVMGAHYDTAIAAVETLLELRAGEKFPAIVAAAARRRDEDGARQ